MHWKPNQVPLRYPLEPCGSRSFIMDFAPSLPKALLHTTQDGQLMLKQNRFSFRTLRRGLAGKVRLLTHNTTLLWVLSHSSPYGVQTSTVPRASLSLFASLLACLARRRSCANKMHQQHMPSDQSMSYKPSLVRDSGIVCGWWRAPSDVMGSMLHSCEEVPQVSPDSTCVFNVAVCY